MKSVMFCKRTVKEILRDPLSYIFCLGFPILMLVIMTIINKSVPPQAGLDIFEMSNLAPGMAFFGLSFVMIFACIQVSQDRSTSLIMRLHASPMKSADFIVGYTLPMFVVAFLQIIITYTTAIIIALCVGDSLDILHVLISIPVMIPSMFMFIALGLLFGTIFNEKAAPGACSAIVTIAGMIGGVWMPVDTMGGKILDICKALPFYHGVKTARYAIAGEWSEILLPCGITLLWALAIYIIAVICMSAKLKKDVR